jgi:protein-disulfide isomerase
MRPLLRVIAIVLLWGIHLPVMADDFIIGEPHTAITAETMAQSRVKAITKSHELLHNAMDVVVGNPNGKVTLVQFVDFSCPLSEKMDHVIQSLIKANPDLRVVYKPYPVHGTISKDAAEAALSAKSQGKYLNYHIALMKIGKNLTDANIISTAAAEGLDSKAVQNAIQGRQYNSQLEATHQLAQFIGIPGTPALFFAKTDLKPGTKDSAIIFMLGGFEQNDLQSAIDKVAQ